MMLLESQMLDSTIIANFLNYIKSEDPEMGDRFKAQARPKAAQSIVQLISNRLG